MSYEVEYTDYDYRFLTKQEAYEDTLLMNTILILQVIQRGQLSLPNRKDQTPQVIPTNSQKI